MFFWLLHNLVEARFHLLRYLLLGKQLIFRKLQYAYISLRFYLTQANESKSQRGMARLKAEAEFKATTAATV